jgi:hypothetical protein
MCSLQEHSERSYREVMAKREAERQEQAEKEKA